MTRENKAGLVVASSFLILVGAVVAVKMREPGQPADAEPPGEVAQAPVTPPVSVPSAPEATKSTKAPPVESKPAPQDKPAAATTPVSEPPPPAPGGTPVAPLPGSEGAPALPPGASPPAPTEPPPTDTPSPSQPPADDGPPSPPGGERSAAPAPEAPSAAWFEVPSLEDLRSALPELPEVKPQEKEKPEEKVKPEPPAPPLSPGETAARDDEKKAGGEDKIQQIGGQEQSKPVDRSPPLPGEAPPLPGAGQPDEKPRDPVPPPVKDKEPGKDKVKEAPPSDNPGPLPPPPGAEPKGVEILPPDPPPPAAKEKEKPETKGPDKEPPQKEAAPKEKEQPAAVSPPAPAKTVDGRPLENSEFIPRKGAESEKGAVSGGEPRLLAPRPKAGGEDGSDVKQTSGQEPPPAPPGGGPGRPGVDDKVVPAAEVKPKGKPADVPPPPPAEDKGARREVAPPAETKPVPIATVPVATGGPRPRTEPVAAGALTAAAKGDSYRVERHSAAQGDTWESLGKRYYGSEQAAAALREFNRAYPWASERMHLEGKLSPGEAYFIPPLDVLRRYHNLRLDAPGR